MNEPVSFEFFCTEEDYPKFRAHFPEEFPVAYADFVARVERRIAGALQQITLTRVWVHHDEFVAYCENRKQSPNWAALMFCAQVAWADATGGHLSG